jgi:hypothetical protein
LLGASAVTVFDEVCVCGRDESRVSGSIDPDDDMSDLDESHLRHCDVLALECSATRVTLVDSGSAGLVWARPLASLAAESADRIPARRSFLVVLRLVLSTQRNNKAKKG